MSLRDLVEQAGGVTRVAHALGVHRASVYRWCRGELEMGVVHAHNLADMLPRRASAHIDAVVGAAVDARLDYLMATLHERA